MKRWHRHSRGCSTAPPVKTLLAAALITILLGALAHSSLAAEVLLMRQDDSQVLKFNQMKRVWVTNPEILDVVVSGYGELLVYSKSVGRTKLYVWDAAGRHEYAVQVQHLPKAHQVVRQLTNLLGRGLSYTLVDDGTVLVEGIVATEAELERITKVIEAKSDGVKVLNLVTVRQANLTPAEEYRAAFEKLFPDQFRYSTVDERTLVIEGEVVSASERDRMDKIVAAASTISVVDLVQCLEDVQTPEQKRIASIRQAVGDAYDYMELEGDILVISGEALSETEKARIDKIIAAAAGDVTVVNVVSVSSDDRPANVRYAEMLAPVFGNEYTFTKVGNEGLVIEGTAPSAAEEARIKSILELIKDADIINLVSTGPHTPGERALAILQDSLGNDYQITLIAQDTVLVEGVAANTAEQERVDKAIAAAPDEANILSLVSVEAPHTESWAASRYQQALKPVLGEKLTYRVLDEGTLVIEGQLDSVGERERASTIIESLGASSVNILDLITVKPGPDAMAESAAAKKADALTKVMGNAYTATPIDEDTVVVQGIAPSDEEQERLAAVLEQMAGETTVVNMIVAADAAEGKTPAERTVESLRKVMPGNLQLIALDERSVLVEGIVETTIDKDRADKIAEAAAESGSVSVLSLVLTKVQSQTPAARRVEHLKRILGDKYNYIVWDDDTVLVEGDVESQAELDKVTTILEAADKDFKVGNMVTYAQPTATSSAGTASNALVERISSAIGEPYRVWHLKENKLVVEGVAADQVAMGRLTMLLEAFADEAQIIQLVSVAPEPVVPLTARAESLRTILGDLFQVRTLQDRAIVVEGTVTKKGDAERARSIIEAFGKEVSVVDLITEADPAKRQILAHVRVLDINRGTLKSYGVNWGQLTGGGGSGGETGFGDQPFLIQVEGGVNNVANLAANVDALKSTDAARVLAEPNLVVNDGEEAEMVVGGEIPIPVPQVGAGVSSITIEYKEYGVVLKIKPTIMDDGKTIQLDISPEVSSIDTATQVSIAGISVPAFRTRKARTVVDMPDGATLVIGGLLQHDQSRVVQEIPLLSKLPIIGSLFKSKSWSHGMSELIIMVTPEILKTTKS